MPLLQTNLPPLPRSPDSPVLWIRLDPEFSVVRETVVEQPDYQWQFQLRHERDVASQTEAVDALVRFPSPASRSALTDVLENEQCFYRVRIRAAHALAKVRVREGAEWRAPWWVRLFGFGVFFGGVLT